ncbi:type I restriction endonuclease subunit R [Lentzea sp. CC55]|uniref:type I restriction endonuclease subunit R n=1 Tax=Lentzea sp. CC55 TaxID=2884909 RepID=UPI001F24AC4E|nr:HsdR family type I site-specific deoxyribonuclease [Lentzea sp. CC55]MCG8921432.1 HsdR family type I site-specific deoxyribonuclease [Lentzea sp. CC55]
MQREWDEVHKPLIDQLVAMGWTHLPRCSPGSTGSGRDSFTDVVLPGRLRDAVHRINPGPDGRPWLDGPRLDTIVSKVMTGIGRGVPGNLAFTELLTGAELTVEGLSDPDRPRPIRLIDWDEPENNDLLAVSKFQIDTPIGPKANIELDLVLFVNGLPLVVVECKAPGPGAVDHAIEQLLDYAGAARDGAVADLVRFVQLLVATDREGAEYGTITAEPAHFASWQATDDDVQKQARDDLGKFAELPLLPQEVLAAEMLRPKRLLDIVRNFTVSQRSRGRTTKIVARWPQYRAVQRMIARLEGRHQEIAAGKRPDHRGGVIWHTQGSGKSLTMTFLVRALRRHQDLSGFKVVVVTDRIDLEDQIAASLGGSGQTPHRATSVDSARADLARDTPDLILVTIQKAQRDEDADDGVEESLGEDQDDTHVQVSMANANPEIVVLVDEAHRSQDSWLHARLRAMVPNAVLIGFTGTPILSGTRKHTSEIFGPIIDPYTLKHAEKDGAVVPVRYEAWEAGAEIVERLALDTGFDEAVPEADRRQRVLGHAARSREVLEAADLIRLKAEHMFHHWVRYILPDRFSAQVVAVSRKAAVRYREALKDARDRLLAELDSLSPSVLHDPAPDVDERVELLRLAHDNRELLEQLDVVPVISQGRRSGGSNSQDGRSADPAEWRRWTMKEQQRKHIARFKDGLGDQPASAHEPWQIYVPEGDAVLSVGDPWHTPAEPRQLRLEAKTGSPSAPIAFLTVKSMLLTGFDAPVEQVLYVDRPMKNVELLQAIARTNRPSRNKKFGLVVDYVAIADALVRAMADYDIDHLQDVIGDTDAQAFMQRLDEAAVPWLREQHRSVLNFLTGLGISSLESAGDREQLLAFLDDVELRADFDEKTKSFLIAVNAVLPRPQALQYEAAVRQLGEVQYLARCRYRDSQDSFNPRRYGAKVRALIDKHIQATDVVQRIPPVEITAPDFAEKVEALPDDRARALEMKHALRSHISARLTSDPVTYQRLSDRLEEILERLGEDHDFGQAFLAMMDLHGDTVAQDQVVNEHGLDRWTEQPVYSLLEQALAALPDEATTLRIDLVDRARLLSRTIAVEVQPHHFPYNGQVRDRARKTLVGKLKWDVKLPLSAARYTADRLMELATRNRERFLRLVSKSAM